MPKGYIHVVIVFSMFVSVYKLCSIKHFSETTVPRILNFSTNVRYVLLYFVKKNWPAFVNSSIYLSIFLSLQ